MALIIVGEAAVRVLSKVVVDVLRRLHRVVVVEQRAIEAGEEHSVPTLRE